MTTSKDESSSNREAAVPFAAFFIHAEEVFVVSVLVSSSSSLPSSSLKRNGEASSSVEDRLKISSAKARTTRKAKVKTLSRRQNLTIIILRRSFLSFVVFFFVVFVSIMSRRFLCVRLL